MVTLEKGKVVIEIGTALPAETLEGLHKILPKLILGYFRDLNYTPTPDSIAPLIPALQFFTALEPPRQHFEAVYVVVHERIKTLEWLFGMDQEKAAREYWERLEQKK